VNSDDITLVHQFLWRVEELCQDNKLEIVDPGTKEHFWRVLLTVRGLYERQIPSRVESMTEFEQESTTQTPTISLMSNALNMTLVFSTLTMSSNTQCLQLKMIYVLLSVVSKLDLPL